MQCRTQTGSQVQLRQNLATEISEIWVKWIVHQILSVISMDWFKGKFTGLSPIFNGKIYGFRLRFSQRKPPIDDPGWGGSLPLSPSRPWIAEISVSVAQGWSIWSCDGPIFGTNIWEDFPAFQWEMHGKCMGNAWEMLCRYVFKREHHRHGGVFQHPWSWLEGPTYKRILTRSHLLYLTIIRTWDTFKSRDGNYYLFVRFCK